MKWSLRQVSVHNHPWHSWVYWCLTGAFWVSTRTQITCVRAELWQEIISPLKKKLQGVINQMCWTWIKLLINYDDCRRSRCSIEERTRFWIDDLMENPPSPWYQAAPTCNQILKGCYLEFLVHSHSSWEDEEGWGKRVAVKATPSAREIYIYINLMDGFCRR